MLAWWVVSAIVLRMSTSMRVTREQINLPVILPTEIEENVTLLTTTILVYPTADVRRAFKQPYLILKEELGFWMNHKQPGVSASDINVYSVEEIVGRSSFTDSRRFDITWFLLNSDKKLTKEQASSTTIQWRWTNLPWAKNPREGTQMLVTTLYVDNNLVENAMTSPYEMLKDELIFWMEPIGERMYRQDITISNVEHKQFEPKDSYSQTYEITWNLNFFDGKVSKEHANKKCVWRSDNTLDRHEMTEDLLTYLYFDGSFDETNVVTNPNTRDQMIQDRFAAEFDLQASHIKINKIEQQHLNDIYGGHQYRIHWAGRLPKDEANKIIEWGEKNVELLTTTVSIDPNADVQQALKQPYFLLKDELAHWFSIMADNTTITADDVNVVRAEKIDGTPIEKRPKFTVTWFLYNLRGTVTKELANSTEIQWRKTNLQWVNPPEGTQMLVTNLWVYNPLAVDMTNPYQMVKDELVFWMASSGKRVRRKNVRIFKVVYDQWDTQHWDSKKYEITWYVLEPTERFSEELAVLNCIWRYDNTYERHEMATDLTTTFYFDKDFNDFNFVTHQKNRANQLADRLAAEFQLRSTDIKVTNMEKVHVYDVHGGQQYRVIWDGPLPADEAKVVIEWSKQNK